MKTLLLFLLITPLLLAKFQSVSIGTIAPEYQDKLAEEDIYTTLLSIEQQFRSQLGYSVFTYSGSGKPINVVYIEPSAKKKKILKLKKELSRRLKELDLLEHEGAVAKKEYKREKTLLHAKYEQNNQRVKELNDYIKRMNIRTKKGISKEEYRQYRAYTKQERADIDAIFSKLRKEQEALHQKFNKIKRHTKHYNQLVREYNAVRREKEQFSKDYIEVKGVTKSNIKTTRITTIKNGKKSVKTNKNINMDKIEIYDFETLAKFKAVLAHEIGHLVGVGHVQAKGALMNPLLQKEQLKHLSLTPADIEAFDKVFHKQRQ